MRRARRRAGTSTRSRRRPSTRSPETELFFVLDTLDYLVKGGRAGRAQGMAAALLNIKPVLQVTGGVIEPFKKSKGTNKAIREMAEHVAERSRKLGPLRIVVVHAVATNLADELSNAIRSAGTDIAEITVDEIGAVIGTHVGPRAVGVGYAPASDPPVSRAGVQRAMRLTALDEPVTAVRFVDGPRAEALARVGVATVEDLLRHYPGRWLDLRTTAPLGSLPLGMEATAVGTVHEVVVKRPRPRLTITEVALVDDSGVLVGVWFNQPVPRSSGSGPGDRVAFAGTVQMEFGLRQMRTPFVERLGSSDDASWLGRILPVHPATEGLSSNWIRRLVAEALDQYGDLPDPAPGRAARRARTRPARRRDPRDPLPGGPRGARRRAAPARLRRAARHPTGHGAAAPRRRRRARGPRTRDRRTGSGARCSARCRSS